MPALDKMQKSLKAYKDAHTAALNELEELQSQADQVKEQALSIESKQGEITAIDRRYTYLQGYIEDLRAQFADALFEDSQRAGEIRGERDEIYSEMEQLSSDRAELVASLDDIDGEHARELYDAAAAVSGPKLGTLPRNEYRSGLVVELEEADEEAKRELQEARKAVQKAAEAASRVAPEGWKAKDRRAEQRRREKEEQRREDEERRRQEKEEERERRKAEQVQRLRERGKRPRDLGPPGAPYYRPDDPSTYVTA